MSGCLVRSPVELRRFVVQQELKQLVQDQQVLAQPSPPSSPFHALRNGTAGSPASASTRSASASEQSTARARSPFAHSPKGSARGISSARSSARAKLKEPRALNSSTMCISDSSTSASRGVQPEDPVRPSPVPRSLVARYDAIIAKRRPCAKSAARGGQCVRLKRRCSASMSRARYEVIGSWKTTFPWRDRKCSSGTRRRQKLSDSRKRSGRRRVHRRTERCLPTSKSVWGTHAHSRRSCSSTGAASRRSVRRWEGLQEA